MSLIVLVAAILALLAVVVSSAFVGIRTIELWRGFRAFTKALGSAADAVTAAADRAADRAGKLGERDDLGLSLARLAVSRARLAVLLAAWGDVRASFGRLTAVVPRKS